MLRVGVVSAEKFADYTRDKGNWLADTYRKVDAWPPDDPWPDDL